MLKKPFVSGTLMEKTTVATNTREVKIAVMDSRIAVDAVVRRFIVITSLISIVTAILYCHLNFLHKLKEVPSIRQWSVKLVFHVQ